MNANGEAERSGDEASSAIPLPAIAIPKGGGAARGIGEKFDVSAQTGTGSLSIPLPLSPGRSRFGPELRLAYDSGQGNGPYGLGWTVGVPTISRKTDKGLPRYADGEESDVFVLSGAEDLVPLLDGAGKRLRRTENLGPHSYTVDRYVPRTEGLYARIERWRDELGATHWRTISTENVTTFFGRGAESQVADPADTTRVATWLISDSYDGRGNAVHYRYKPEDSTGVDSAQAHERNRTLAGRSAQRYLKAVQYANRQPRFADDDLTTGTDWLFEVVIDYGEHYGEDGGGQPTLIAAGDGTQPWGVRADPFSSYRTGFELRTYRLCRSILLFHHIPEELGTADCLVNAMLLDYDERPTGTLLKKVTQAGFVRREDGTYLKRTLPPLELGYTEGALDGNVHELEGDTLAELPTSGRRHSWADLEGDGVAGVLVESEGGWRFTRNLSPASDDIRFAPDIPVGLEPRTAGGAHWQWIDIGGDGQPDLVQLAGRGAGYFERQPDGGWGRFASFPSVPSIVWDGDVTVTDLTGDGRPDILATRDDGRSWFASLGEDGFTAEGTVVAERDEERGPRLVLAEPTHTVLLADLSGDGLADLVRVRNGEVCYWPALGYGRFGAKVTMDDAPWLDAPESFDARRLRLADIDGTGPTDLLYVGDEGVVLYSNESGNCWGPAQRLDSFPQIDRAEAVQVTDLRGNGTACLVWTSELAGEERRRLRYVELTGGVKPNLLASVANGLGATTTVTYASSTSFALRDALAGNPWATRLPFPVQVVVRVQVDDAVARTRFTTRYAYHHGAFDGLEREFRGFGLVEQWDTEELAVLSGADDLPPANLDPASHVPPVLTRSWFHTGCFLEEGSIDAAYAQEYYAEPGLDPATLAGLRPKTALPDGLTPDELREAVRTLKGVLLHKEVYALDGSPAEPHPYSASHESYTVECLQHRQGNRHSVMRSLARESVDFEYDRELVPSQAGLASDPRTRHVLLLDVDDFGNGLRSVEIVYGRRHADPSLGLADQQRQLQPLVTLKENGYTNVVDAPTARRSPRLYETRAYELLHVAPPGPQAVPALLSLEAIRAAADAASDGAHDLPYEDVQNAGAVTPHAYRRLAEHTLTLFRSDDLSGTLAAGTVESLALEEEVYALAFTPSLLALVYGGTVDAAQLAAAGYVQPDGTNWWTRKAKTRLSPTPGGTPAQELAYARQHFFLPRRSLDPFGNEATVIYDGFDLLPLETRDPLGNRMTAGERSAGGAATPRLDYRTLQPLVITDLNRNRTEFAYDALGRLAALAIAGKTGQQTGDTVAGVVTDLSGADLDGFVANPLANAAPLLGDATRRVLYDLDRFAALGLPAFSATLAREHHVADPDDTGAIQLTIQYADGAGDALQQKVRVAPGPIVDGGPTVDPRWVGSSWTILDNKGQAVRIYEPFFSATHEFEFARKEGVSSVVLYDALGRSVGNLQPGHAYEKIVYGPWRHEAWNAGDTVLRSDPRTDPDVGDWLARLPSAEILPSWRDARTGGALGAAEQDAASKSPVYADTPTVSHLDALGRVFLVTEESGGGAIEHRLQLDIEGNPLALVDALGRTCVTSIFDVQGRRLSQTSIDSGARRQFPDVEGKTIHSWDANGWQTRIVYDELRRVTELHVTPPGSQEFLAEQAIHGESQGDAANLRGQVYTQHDSVGVVTNVAFDVDGNLVHQQRQLATLGASDPDWSGPVALEAEVFETRTRSDALKRIIEVQGPDGTVSRTAYDEGGRIARVEANVRGEAATTILVAAAEHNARGEPIRVTLGNGVVSTYVYDSQTFALANQRTTRGATVLQDITYTRDVLGNTTWRADAAQQTLFFRNAVVTSDGDYTYDALQRLVRAKGREHVGQGLQTPVYEPFDAPRTGLASPQDGQAMRRYSEKYAYDLVGNLTNVSHTAQGGSWTRRYQYAPNSNRLDSTSLPSDPAGPLPARYTTDANGNCTRMPHLARLGWDQKDRLRSVDLGGGGTGSYVYGSGGDRVRKVVHRFNGTRLRERIYLGTVEIAREYAGDGVTVTLERQTLRGGPGTAALVETRTLGMDAGAGRLVRYQVADGIGSVALELDAAGAIITFEEYYPYGGTSYQAVRSQTETPKRTRYNGKERDEETGLYAAGARYYAAWLARFISADPAGTADGMNLYAYVRDNPMNTVDPTGRDGKNMFSTEGKYAHHVHFKTREEYVNSNSAGALENEDGSYDAIVWDTKPEVTIAPQKPASKPAPPKPKPKPPPRKPDPPPMSAHDLSRLVDALQPKLIYPKPVRQFFGGVQLIGGSVEAVGGAFAGFVTSETIVGAVGGFAVAAHGVDNVTSGWTLMWTGEESKTWTFMIGAGYASTVTDDRELQNAIGSSTETLANIGSAGYGMYSLGSTSTVPKLTMPPLVGDAEGVALQGINTGGPLIGRINCGFCTIAGADAVPTTSSQVASSLGVSEMGPGVGRVGLSYGEMGQFLEQRGLGSATPSLKGATVADAQAWMSRPSVQPGTKFAIGFQWAKPWTGGHAINGRVGAFGLYFIDNQLTLGSARPFFNLPSNATNVYVWTVYDPTW
jgi:RHS repeat-associated protein